MEMLWNLWIFTICKIGVHFNYNSKNLASQKASFNTKIHLICHLILLYRLIRTSYENNSMKENCRSLHTKFINFINSSNTCMSYSIITINCLENDRLEPPQ